MVLSFAFWSGDARVGGRRRRFRDFQTDPKGRGRKWGGEGSADLSLSTLGLFLLFLRALSDGRAAAAPNKLLLSCCVRTDLGQLLNSAPHRDNPGLSRANRDIEDEGGSSKKISSACCDRRLLICLSFLEVIKRGREMEHTR